jgi:hypothetical protein
MARSRDWSPFGGALGRAAVWLACLATSTLLGFSVTPGPDDLATPLVLERPDDVIEIAADAERTSTPGRPIYRHSVVRGGVYSAAEVRDAVARDPVVATHYDGLSLDRLRAVRVAVSKAVYVSYRVGDHVAWANRPIPLWEGEIILTDGVNAVRARCGNRISDTAVAPSDDAAARDPLPNELDQIEGQLSEPVPLVADGSTSSAPASPLSAADSGTPQSSVLAPVGSGDGAVEVSGPGYSPWWAPFGGGVAGVLVFPATVGGAADTPGGVPGPVDTTPGAPVPGDSGGGTSGSTGDGSGNGTSGGPGGGTSGGSGGGTSGGSGGGTGGGTGDGSGGGTNGGTPPAVPEPRTVILVAIGLGAALLRRRCTSAP